MDLGQEYYGRNPFSSSQQLCRLTLSVVLVLTGPDSFYDHESECNLLDDPSDTWLSIDHLEDGNNTVEMKNSS